MSKSFQRYEILLPLKHNDGRPVPRKFVGETIQELKQRFGAISAETQTIRGWWSSEGQDYQDDLVRVFLDVQDDEDTRKFFESFKQTLKVRFEQLDIWMTTYPVEVL